MRAPRPFDENAGDEDATATTATLLFKRRRGAYAHASMTSLHDILRGFDMQMREIPLIFTRRASRAWYYRARRSYHARWEGARSSSSPGFSS